MRVFPFFNEGGLVSVSNILGIYIRSLSCGTDNSNHQLTRLLATQVFWYAKTTLYKLSIQLSRLPSQVRYEVLFYYFTSKFLCAVVRPMMCLQDL